MSVKIQIENFGGNSIERANKLLAGCPGEVEKAVKSAMTRAVSHLRAKSTERIQERYAISAKNLRTEKNIKVKYKIGDGVTAEITFSGRRIPLYRYDGTSPKEPTWDRNRLLNGYTKEGWKTLLAGKPARAHVLKNTSPELFEHAFVATMSNDHHGIFERNGSGLNELMGLSIPQMVGNEEVAEKLAQDASEKFEERMEHEVNRILNGWTN